MPISRAIFFGLALALGAAAPSSAAELTPFKIGISAPVVTIFPVWMGEAGGFYEKEGLKVDVINMEGGTRGLQVLLSGEIQGMHVGLAPAVLANKQGADLRLVTSTCNTIPITMFTKAGVGMGDLKGKTCDVAEIRFERHRSRSHLSVHPADRARAHAQHDAHGLFHHHKGKPGFHLRRLRWRRPPGGAGHPATAAYRAAGGASERDPPALPRRDRAGRCFHRQSSL